MLWWLGPLGCELGLLGSDGYYFVFAISTRDETERRFFFIIINLNTLYRGVAAVP